MPLRHRCEYAAVLPRSLPGSSCPPPREFPTGLRQVRAASSPDPPGFELAPHQGGVTRRFLAYSSPSRLPDPDHLAVLVGPGVVRAAPTLPSISRIRLPSASTQPLRRPGDEGLSPPFDFRRLVAHMILRPIVANKDHVAAS